MSGETMASEDADASPFDACAHCRATFEPNERYPVVTVEGPDGTLELYSFCDEDCQDAWLARRDP